MTLLAPAKIFAFMNCPEGVRLSSDEPNLRACYNSNRIFSVTLGKLETLDDLLAQAEHYANHSMRNIGRLPPTLFLIGPDGPLMFMPESFAD